MHAKSAVLPCRVSDHSLCLFVHFDHREISLFMLSSALLRLQSSASPKQMNWTSMQLYFVFKLLCFISIPSFFAVLLVLTKWFHSLSCRLQQPHYYRSTARSVSFLPFPFLFSSISCCSQEWTIFLQLGNPWCTHVDCPAFFLFMWIPIKTTAWVVDE